MKNIKFFARLGVLAVLTLLFFMYSLGFMVSKKFEVDESYWQVETPLEIQTLDEKGFELEMKSLGCAIGGCLTLATGVLYIVRKVKKIDPSV